jgi:hypothetical protein
MLDQELIASQVKIDGIPGHIKRGKGSPSKELARILVDRT